MSTELFTPRPFSSRPPKLHDYGSTISCSSSEASSRLAARLERSEYKRSRAKQRAGSSTRSRSRRKNSRSRRKNSSTRETRAKSEEDGVTSVWEVYRQNPYYYSDRTTEDKRDHRNTWYGVPSSSTVNNQPSKRRPQSIHIGSSNYNHSEYQPWSPGRHTERNSYNNSFNDNLNDSNSFEHSKEMNNIDSKFVSHRTPSYREALNNYTEIQGDYSLDKKGMYLSRSLSSSFSSYVGSSDEKEDSQGIYSAYDVASRSPYESMVSRRYSQSSLSSSNASWHQHQGPTALNYNMRDIPPLLDAPTSKSNQKSYSKKANESNEFQTIKETTPPAVAPKPKRFSSSYTIQLHPSLAPKDNNHYNNTYTNKSNTISSKDQIDGKATTVREMARKFTPTSVKHISSVYNKPDDHSNNVIESQISAVTVAQQESTPSVEKHRELPQTRVMNDEKTKVVMRQKEPSGKTAEELASHRLSLQELIQLHEEQIAIQTQSAKTVLAHAYYIKRSPETSPARSNDIEVKPKTGNSESKEDNSDKKLSSVKQQDSLDYEVREVLVSQSSPFKVIELTDKTADTPRGRASRLKRHRTIGIVGYRHQIDRTAGEKVQTKLKRHTTVGIFSDFTDSSEGLAKSREALKQELQKESPFRSEDHTDNNASQVEARQDTNKKPFPVKIFDIEASSNQREPEQEETSQSLANEQPVNSESAEQWFTEVTPGKEFVEQENDVQSSDKDFTERENDIKYAPDIEDSTDKAESTSSVTMQPQQDFIPVPKPITSTEKYTSTNTFHDPPSRNSHSPVVELIPERNGNTTAYYKSPYVNYHGYSSNTRELTSDLSDNLLYVNKNHPVPVAQVSPVSHSFGSQEIIEAKAIPLVSSPPPDPPSAHEMYETRLALWDLLPRKDKSSSDLSEHQSNEGRFSAGEQHSKQSYAKEKSPVKFTDQPYQRNITLHKNENRFSQNFQRLDKTEEYYLGVIDNLKAENQRLKEKNEAEKREFKRMYEEQKKVANAYQKLEDRYRRRVHELQDALASCTCQGSLMLKETDLKSSQLHHGRSKENHTYKLQESSKSGMRMFEELEEWLSEQSKNSKAPKVNAASRDSLISSSSDLTGTGWDEHYMSGGDIDEVNGTHV